MFLFSQINTIRLLYFISYSNYSSAFTINQFHNHDVEVYAPLCLVSCYVDDHWIWTVGEGEEGGGGALILLLFGYL